jgi:hypothetical protein
MKPKRAHLTLLVSAFFMSCTAVPEHTETKKEPAKTPAPTAAAPDKSSRVPTKPAKKPFRVTCLWIVVSHEKAAQGFPDGESRDRAVAWRRAKEALAKARDPNVDFVEIVKRYTDDSEGKARNGALGNVLSPKVPPGFQAVADALFGMEIGQVSDVVQSPMGFHVMMRTPVFSAAHILIQYKGSSSAKPEITRTKEAAEKFATELTTRAKAPGADFAALAREHSDGPKGPKGGDIGMFGSGQMAPEFEKALVAIKEGEVTGPVETRFGFHFIKRTTIEFVRASHILI